MEKLTTNIREKIAKKVAEQLKENQIVNLGVGIPTLVPDFISEKTVFLQSENGLLGMGPTPPVEGIDMDLISASKKPITIAKGASLFDSAESFSMIRGGHIDVAVLGGLQVSETGEIANWAVPGKDILGVGGAMDLVVGAKNIIITMTHQSKEGTPKLVKQLTYPTSGVRKANMVITDKAVFTFHEGRMHLLELDPTVTLENLRQITEAGFEISEYLKYDYI